MGSLETVWSAQLSAADGEAYDEFVDAARGGHFSQTRAWAKVATAGRPFTPSFFLARRNGHVAGAALVLRSRLWNTLALPFAQIERGPVSDDPEHLPAVLRVLREQALRRGIVRFSVMPCWIGESKKRAEQLLKQNGYADRQSFGGRHVRSLLLDLTNMSDNNLFAGRALFKVRQNIGRAERAGATARQGQKRDLAAYRTMHEQLLRLEGKQPPGVAWYNALAGYFLPPQGRGSMFVCEYQKKIVSAIFVALHGMRATYVMGASSGQPLRFPKMILPMAAAIAWAKRAGAKIFDLGGIPMEGDTDTKRASIAEFKRSFSRTEVAFPHEHVRWF